MDSRQFLEGGGEMGELVRNYDWENSILGKPEVWPLSLQTTVGILLHSSFPMLLLWGEDLICFYNDAFRPSLGSEGKHPAIGKKGMEMWPEIWEFIGPLMKKVMTTGEPVWFEDQLVPFYRNGRIEDIYWTFSYSAAYGDDGRIAGVFVVCHETTAKVKALAELQEQRNQLTFAIDAAELGTWELEPATNKFRGNDRLKEWFGLKPEEEIDLSRATDVIAEKDRAQVTAAIAYALTYESGGHYDVEYTIQNPRTGRETIVKAKGRAYFDEQKRPYTFNGTLQDVTADAVTRKRLAIEITEQLKAKKRLEESELFSHSVFYNSPVAKLVFTGEDMIVERINENMLNMLGRDQGIVGKPFFDVMPELVQTPLRDRLLEVLLTGKTYTQPEEKIILLRNGLPHTGYYNYAYKALVSAAGAIYGIMATATDVTEQVVSRQSVEAKEGELRDLITAAPIGICVVSGQPLWVEEVNERFLLIAGKTRQQFETAAYWEVMHEIAPQFEDILDGVFQTGIKFTSEEHEMVLIRAGVAEKIYATFQYIPITGTDDIVTKVIIMVIEVTYQVETRKQVEDAVVRRTRELGESNLRLKRSNEELEQFAYIASHDLQEPIRKISIFTQMLEDNLPAINEKSKGYISKIYNSADRMTKLIRDVLAFSKVSKDMGNFGQVDLNKIMETVQTDFELPIKETGATIDIAPLPTLEAIPSQMVQLFSNLLSNSLKYHNPGVKPVITISVSLAQEQKVAKRLALERDKKYYHISFRDNGIGFNQEYAERIFRIFQRLHNDREFEGTGIGLSICKKIVQNHNGHIAAEAGEHGGAVFNILLPEVQHEGNHSL